MRPTGPVVSVLDGDTIEVLYNQRPERIRLSSTDRPEKCQTFDLLADPAAAPDNAVALTRGAAGRVAGMRMGS